MVASRKGEIKFGLAAPTFAGYEDAHVDVPCIDRIDFGVIRDATVMAERSGFDSVWLADHLILGRKNEILEAWTCLSALAAITSKLSLGTLVVNVLLRHPGLLAKMSSTLDLISGGRLVLGLGSGSLPEELDSYGFGYPNSAIERVRLLEETIRVLKLLWSGQSVRFSGESFSLDNAVCAPPPIQQPHIPILIGCLSDSKAIHRVVARHADIYNTIGTIEDFSRRLSILREMCTVEGRDISVITPSLDAHVLIGRNEAEVSRIKHKILECSPRFPSTRWNGNWIQSSKGREWEDFEQLNFIGTPSEVTEKLMKYVGLGCRYYMLWFLDLPKHDGLRLFAETVIPNVKDENKV